MFVCVFKEDSRVTALLSLIYLNVSCAHSTYTICTNSVYTGFLRDTPCVLKSTLQFPSPRCRPTTFQRQKSLTPVLPTTPTHGCPSSRPGLSPFPSPQGPSEVQRLEPLFRVKFNLVLFPRDTPCRVSFFFFFFNFTDV